MEIWKGEKRAEGHKIPFEIQKFRKSSPFLLGSNFQEEKYVSSETCRACWTTLDFEGKVAISQVHLQTKNTIFPPINRSADPACRSIAASAASGALLLAPHLYEHSLTSPPSGARMVVRYVHRSVRFTLSQPPLLASVLDKAGQGTIDSRLIFDLSHQYQGSCLKSSPIL